MTFIKPKPSSKRRRLWLWPKCRDIRRHYMTTPNLIKQSDKKIMIISGGINRISCSESDCAIVILMIVQ